MLLLLAQITVSYLIGGVATLCIFEYFGVVGSSVRGSKDSIDQEVDRGLTLAISWSRKLEGEYSEEELEALREYSVKVIVFKFRARLILGWPLYILNFIHHHNIL